MKNTSNILKRFTVGKSFAYGDQLSPQRDWLFLLVGALLVFCLSCAWNAWTFVRIESGETLTDAPIPAPSTVNSSTLKDLETLFAARSIEEAHYIADYHFVDPSN